MPDPHPVAVLIDDADRVLLTHAHDPHQPDHRWWELPGGGFDPGASPEDACLRFEDIRAPTP